MNPFRTLQGWCLHMRGLDPQMLRNSSEASKTPQKKSASVEAEVNFSPATFVNQKNHW